MIDEDPQLFTAEVIHRVMLTYRDIQVCNGRDGHAHGTYRYVGAGMIMLT